MRRGIRCFRGFNSRCSGRPSASNPAPASKTHLSINLSSASVADTAESPGAYRRGGSSIADAIGILQRALNSVTLKWWKRRYAPKRPRPASSAGIPQLRSSEIHRYIRVSVATGNRLQCGLTVSAGEFGLRDKGAPLPQLPVEALVFGALLAGGGHRRKPNRAESRIRRRLCGTGRWMRLPSPSPPHAAHVSL